MDPGHGSTAIRAGHRVARHLVREDTLLEDPEFLEYLELRFRAPRGIVGLADPALP